MSDRAADRRCVWTCRTALLLQASLLFSAGSASAIDFVPDARDTINVTGFGNVDTESNYVPYVVYFENGLASEEALKAQAVAARTYAYYQMQNKGFINNGTDDQVYFKSGRGLPKQKHYDAAAATEGEIITFNDTLVCAFYVAGAIPTDSSKVPGTIAQATASSSDPTTTEKWVTYTWENGDLGNQNIGTPLGFRGTPTNPFYVNRGAKSQNGANYMGTEGYTYMDILKYYYGADIQIEQVRQGETAIFSRRSLSDFEGNVGYFGNDPFENAASNSDLGSGTSVSLTSVSKEGSSGQLLDIDFDEAADGEGDGFIFRHAAGATLATDLAGDEAANVVLDALGDIGFWMKTTTPGLSVALHIDEEGGDSESSTVLDLIADGQWHKYSWSLEDDSDWFKRADPIFEGGGGGGRPGTGNQNQVTPGGTGAVEDRFSIDSIIITGSSDALVYLDDVFYDPQAIPPIPGDFDDDGVVTLDDLDLLLAGQGNSLYDVDGDGDADLDDITLWVEGLYGGLMGDTLFDGDVDLADLSTLAFYFGQAGAWENGDFNGDGIVNLLDLSILATNFNKTAVPEPAMGMVSLLGLALLRRR
ncbi:SpoIID/LytB domain-containing protein [Mucisphaera calidilacus]|uniref:Stage II sporulation protein n=1 Tax=Mucisphaera calidilacus TaxID=2527982 RepID=A0A518BW81_9BACT|nr:SpoIID/LytB domain-containing protein [Mucisphaera calidilacus]QDU71184.1 Stage II sporulation protein [Mucisphaera calidilacus]